MNILILPEPIEAVTDIDGDRAIRIAIAKGREWAACWPDSTPARSRPGSP